MNHYLNKKNNQVRAFESRDVFPDQQPMQGLDGNPVLDRNGNPVMQAAQTSALNQAIDAAVADGFELLTDAQFADWQKAQADARANDPATLAAATKARRQALLAETDPIANRDNRQTAALTSAQVTALAAKGKAITAAQRKELEAYAQALRDVPEAVKTWPSIKDSEWPAKPTWLDAMVKRVQA
jgi:Phage tail assembly chaperone protein